MRSKLILMTLLFLLCFGCDKFKTAPPPSPDPKIMIDYSRNFVEANVEWVNRDYWYTIDGSTWHSKSVAYDMYSSDTVYSFIEKIDSSKISEQTSWSQYQNYRPGARVTTDYVNDGHWTGTHCTGLVYWSAIEANYSINGNCRTDLSCWLSEGYSISWDSVKIGDIILMNFEDSPGWDHIGIIKEKSAYDSTFDRIISSMCLFGYPFEYKVGIHTPSQYDLGLQELDYEWPFPPVEGYKIYNIKYIRLAQ